MLYSRLIFLVFSSVFFLVSCGTGTTEKFSLKPIEVFECYSKNSELAPLSGDEANKKLLRVNYHEAKPFSPNHVSSSLKLNRSIFQEADSREQLNRDGNMLTLKNGGQLFIWSNFRGHKKNSNLETKYYFLMYLNQKKGLLLTDVRPENESLALEIYGFADQIEVSINCVAQIEK